jgi:hypothetical protein
MSGRRVFLSKSKLMSARQCLKRLHLEVHRPELRSISRATESAFATGHQVGDVAQQLYGTADSVFIPYEGGLSHALKKTRRLVNSTSKVPIFEATFQFGGVLVRADALLPDGDGWRIVEVKASTSVKEEHVFDCAIQRWVIEGVGLTVTGVAVAHVDNSFVYGGDGDFQGLLLEVDQTDKTAPLQASVPEWIKAAQRAVGTELPDVPVGAQCNKPYACPFITHCWPSDSDYPVQGLGGSRAKLGQFVAAGYLDMRDVPADRLSEKQARIQDVTITGSPEILSGAKIFTDKLDYPRYYLDFETIMPAVPLWADTRPYETLPFQWSCHYEPAKDELEHAEFLDLSGVPPMRRLAESLIRVLGTSGPVLMYTPYEKRVINSLAERFPDIGAALKLIVERLVDLRPVTEQNYYHPAMAGSWSLKAVLPTIAANMQYDELLGIQEGTAASEGYLEAINAATSEVHKAELEAQLLRYCKFDTEAMVLLTRFLAKPIQDHS